MYPNPLNPHSRTTHSGEISHPSSSRPQTSRDPERTVNQGLPHHERALRGWVDLIGSEKAERMVLLAASGGRIYQNPDNHSIVGLVVDPLPELTDCERVEYAICGSLSERMRGLMYIYDASVMGKGIFALCSAMSARISLEKMLQKCEEVLAPLASPTWIDSHMESETAGKTNEETEEAKGRTSNTTEDAMNEADEADDKRSRQSGKKNKSKSKKKKRKSRVK